MDLVVGGDSLKQMLQCFLCRFEMWCTLALVCMILRCLVRLNLNTSVSLPRGFVSVRESTTSPFVPVKPLIFGLVEPLVSYRSLTDDLKRTSQLIEY